jgi:hypothetical protein
MRLFFLLRTETLGLKLLLYLLEAMARLSGGGSPAFWQNSTL